MQVKVSLLPPLCPQEQVPCEEVAFLECSGRRDSHPRPARLTPLPFECPLPVLHPIKTAPALMRAVHLTSQSAQNPECPGSVPRPPCLVGHGQPPGGASLSSSARLEAGGGACISSWICCPGLETQPVQLRQGPLTPEKALSSQQLPGEPTPAQSGAPAHIWWPCRWPLPQALFLLLES